MLSYKLMYLLVLIDVPICIEAVALEEADPLLGTVAEATVGTFGNVGTHLPY